MNPVYKATPNTVGDNEENEQLGDAYGRSHVVLYDSNGNPLVFYAEDAVHVSGDRGIMALAVRKDTAIALAGADGDYIPLIVDASGRLHIAPLPAGSATIGLVDQGDASTVQQVEETTIIGTITLTGDASVIVTAAGMTNTPKTVTVAVDDGTEQVETATVVGTVVDSGDARVIVTAAGMNNSSKTVDVAVLALDSAADVADKIRTALTSDADVGDAGTGFFTVSGAGADVILTANAAAADDATVNISIDNLTCTGLTAAPTSVDTTAGVAPDDADAVAVKVRAALALDADVSAFFTISGSSADVILTAITAAEDDATLNIAVDNDTCTGLTAVPTSTTTTFGSPGGTRWAMKAAQGAAGTEAWPVVLSANSGVDVGDVDVTSISAGDNNIGNVDIVTLPTGNLGQQAMAASLSVVPANNVTDATYIGDIKFGEALPAGSAIIGKVQPFAAILETDLTEIIDKDDTEVSQNDYSKSVSIALGATMSGEIIGVGLVASELGSGAVPTRAGYLYVFISDPTVSAGDTALALADWQSKPKRVAITDWTSDANGGMCYVTTAIPFAAVDTLYLVFQNLGAAINDAAGDDEELHVYLVIRRDS